MRKKVRSAFVVIAAMNLVACTLPGWDYEHEERSAWFNSEQSSWYAGQRDEETVKAASRIKPVIRKITPAVVRELRSESWIEGLGVSDIPNGDFQSYTVGPGDILQVRVFGHSDMTLFGMESSTREGEPANNTGQLVGPDGQMFFPFVGKFQAAGKTIDEIRQIINQGLAKVIRSPQVDVSMLSYHSKKAYIVDTKGSPCEVPITEFGVTMLDGLVLCGSGGGQSAGSGGSASQVVRLVRDSKHYAVDLSELYKQSDRAIYLRHNDRLLVDRNFNRVFVVGEFGAQSVKSIPPTGLTLAEAMTTDGGLSINTVDPGAIFVIRGLVHKESIAKREMVLGEQPEVFHLNARSVDALALADQFKLRPRDIIFASAADTVDASRAVSQVLPIINSLFQTIFIFDRIDEL